MLRRIFILVWLFISMQVTAGEYLPNPGFERGKQNWNIYPPDTTSVFAIDERVKHSGNAAGRIDGKSPTSRMFIISKFIEVKPSTGYKVGVWYRLGEGISSDAVRVRVNFRKEGSVFASSRWFSHVDKQDGEWRHLTATVKVPDVAQTAEILLGLCYAVGSVWFDDVEVEPIEVGADTVTGIYEYQPFSIEIGAGPLRRWMKMRDENSPLFLSGKRYNELLVRTAYVEEALRQLERVAFYTSRLDDAKPLRRKFREMEKLLDETYRAHGRAFFAKGAADKIAEFHERADGLEKVITSLQQELSNRMKRINRPAGLPALYGAETDESKMWLDENGRCGRILFGTSASINEQTQRLFRFDFCMTPRWNPVKSTPEGCDFSNYTERLKWLRDRGFRKTYAMIYLAVHCNTFAPDWILERAKSDPDMILTAEDGTPASPCTYRLHAPLNYFHPEVRKFIYRTARELAETVKNLDDVLFIEYLQEAYPYFGGKGGRRETGYGESATREWHAYLKRKFGDIAALNRAWRSDYKSFEEIRQPHDRFVKPRRKVTPLIYEFERFRSDFYIDHLRSIYRAFKEGAPNKPVAARHSTLLRNIPGARIFETCDILAFHSGYPAFEVLSVYLNSLNRFAHKGLGYLENAWGIQEDAAMFCDEVVQRRALAKHLYRSSVWGRTTQVWWYVYTTGYYLTKYNGNWFNPRYDLTTMRYSAPALPVTKDRIRRVERIIARSEIAPARILVIEPETSMLVQEPLELSYNEICRLHRLIFPRNFLYELLPESYVLDGRVNLAQFDAVILPAAEYFPDGLADKLIPWVKSGGTLICLGPAGMFDKYGFPDGKLLRELGIHRKLTKSPDLSGISAWKASGSQAAYLKSTAGKGRVIVTFRPVAAGEQPDEMASEILRLLAERVRRSLWTEKNRLEVLMRRTPDGGEFVFALNPSSHETALDTIILRGEVREVTDITIEGGMSVPFEARGANTAIPMRLQPAEFTVFLIRRG